MIIYGALLIPIAVIIILMIFYRKEVTWWEYLVTLGIPAVFIVIFKASIDKMQVTATEYWGGYITQAQYYEPWDEKVSCRHPKYCTRTVTTGSGKNRSTHTESYQCGWQHAYDVDYHPAHWDLVGSNGESFGTTKEDYRRLVQKFGNETFVDMHRSYYSIDGDKYTAIFDNDDRKLEAITTLHTYENRVQAAHSVFNFKEVTDAQKKAYQLYDYPKPLGYRCLGLLGDAGGCTPCANWKLDFWNGKLGRMKQVRMWVLMYKNQPPEAGELQEAYWKGGNKNEFILAIGVDSVYKVRWCRPISWTPSEDLKIDARNFVSTMDTLNIDKVVDWMGYNVQMRFERKQFKDFSYLEVDPPDWAIILTYVLASIISLGLAIFSVRNDARN